MATEPCPQESASEAASFPQARLLLPAIMSAGLLWLCYFPVAWGFLGWIALVPLLTLVRAPGSNRWRYLAAWACGVLFYFPVLQWMRLADARMYATWVILATMGSLYVPAAIWAIRRLDRCAVPLVLSVPVVWTSLEFIRANLGGGFAWYVLGHMLHDIPGGYAWYFLGHTQHALLPLIQVADLAGSYAVTFVVAAINALVFSVCLQWPGWRAMLRLPDERSTRVGWFAPGFCILLLAGTLSYGLVRLDQQDDQPGPRLALLQTNIDQRIRNEAGAPTEDQDSNRAREAMTSDYKTLIAQAMSTAEPPDLIVFPESGYPAEWVELADGFPAAHLPRKWPEAFERMLPFLPAGMKITDFWKFGENFQILETCDTWHTPMLLGLNTTVFASKTEKPRRYNSALYLPASATPIQKGRPVMVASQRYDKVHRVPFGEYIPLRQSLPWLNSFAPYDYEYVVEPGEQFTRFELGEYRFGVLICYEDTDANLARQYAQATVDGPAVDFLVNISNDGWFIGSAEHDEHLALCRFRAVECRRSVARAVNMGISAVIDGSGRIVALPGADWPASKAMAGVVLAQVPIDRRSSIYAHIGDLFAWLCLAGLVIGVLWSMSRPARRVM